MTRRLPVLILAFTLLLGALSPAMAQAAYSPPTVFGAPQNVAVEIREDGDTWTGFEATVSASNELRALVDEVGADNSAFAAEGYYLSDLMLQLDFKIDSGPWHHKTEWDQNFGYNDTKSLLGIAKGTYSDNAIFDKWQLELIAPGETLPETRSFFDTHTMQLRFRFVVVYLNSFGLTSGYFSPWSSTVTYSNEKVMVSPDQLINHAPVLKSAELRTNDTGKPYLRITSEPAHPDLRTLNSVSGNHVKTEVWLKVGQGEWKLAYSGGFEEMFDVAGMEAYFGLREQYSAAAYDARVRYSFDYAFYPASGKSGVIYSPFSNVIAKGMAAYSQASEWAKPELDKANEYGLIPPSLKGADMTRPITREEFAELAVLLYEKATAKASVAASPNPFTDTVNPQILKAFNLGIVKGMSATTFEPKSLTNREQVATMLSRTIRAIAPNGNFATTGAPTFADQKDISDWALEHVQYMAKLGIIKGSNGAFMPKAVTSAQQASGYATTTREQAVAMSVRSFEQMETIKAPAPGASTSGGNLVGSWAYSTGVTNVSLHVALDLRADGTFVKAVGTANSFQVAGTSYTGNYRVNGNKILFYNRMKSTAQGSDMQDLIFRMMRTNAGEAPVADEEVTFSFTDNNHLTVGETTYTRTQ